MTDLILQMIHTTTYIRVRYAETDPMKFVYYGNYATYLEVARVELFRNIGMSYNEIEEKGVWLPVSDFQIKYLKAAKYDDLLEIRTRITELPTAKILFDYEIFHESGYKIATASTSLFFFDPEKQKIIRCPDFLMKLIEKNWKAED